MILRLIVCSFLILVFGGFIAGILHCSDCDGIIDRIFLGCIWSVISVLGFGRVPIDGVGVGYASTWIYGIPVSAVLFVAWTFLVNGSIKKSRVNKKK